MDLKKTLFLFVLFFIERGIGQSEPVVQTKNGAVLGRYNYTVEGNIEYSSFRGIPYAEPPVGNLRFKPPVPVQPWTGTLDATKHGSVCLQYVIEVKEIQGSEDCLNLNVYTPDTNFTRPLTLKPVMVWIYGGGFLYGYSNDSMYGPEPLLKQGVVVVTMNYRVNSFGFLALNHPDALGNAGLKDQYLAMKWVQDNIAAFGGDPNQVTLFGESAGAVSVGQHVLADQAAGLFSKVILMSGSPLCAWGHQSIQEAHQNAYDLGLILGHVSLNDQDLLDFLLATPAMTLLDATLKLNFRSPLPFRVTIENTALDYNNTAYVKQCSMLKYKSGNFSKVPTMIGYTHDEILLFLSPLYTGAQSSNVDLLDYLSKIDPFTTALMYTALNNTLNVTVETAVKVGTDLFFVSPIDETQKQLAANNGNNPIYYYQLSFATKHPFHEVIANVTHPGVAHFDDIPLLYDMVHLPTLTDPNDPDYQTRYKMATMFANFAKYADPTPASNNPINITWTQSGVNGYQIDLNVTCTMNNRLADETAQSYGSILYQTCY